MTAVESFYKYTRYDISSFISDFVEFNDKYYPTIISYYKGDLTLSDSVAFSKLKYLLNQVDIINHHITTHSFAFNSLMMWELIEAIDDIFVKLSTIKNTGKWIKSSIGNNSFTNTVSTAFSMSQNMTLENVSVLNGSIDFENDWFEIAVANNLKETAYSPESLNTISVTQKRTAFVFDIVSVVDIMNGHNVYGKDLNKTILFANDDLLVLSPKDTIYQAVDILINLKKGDNCQYPNHGRSSMIGPGNAVSMMLSSVLSRQLNDTFANDDTLSSFALTDIKIQGDVAKYAFTITTRLNEFINQSI